MTNTNNQIRHNNLIDELPPINKSTRKKRTIAQSNPVPDKDLNVLDAFNALKTSVKKVKKRVSKDLPQSSKRNQTLDSKTIYEEETPKELFLTSEITNKDDALITVANSVPDSYQNIFDFETFNKMQSEAFPLLYQSDDNVVVGAPTGSGKTVLFEMAIIKCLAINAASLKSVKIIYMAPTKALCHEKYVHWQNKFSKIKVGLLTSDTSEYEENTFFYDLNLVLCTPEKLDFLTRRWNDRKKTFMSIKLCLIDEIHTINQERGAVLEAVVTRMMKLNSKSRIVTVSATVPNIIDIKNWITTKSKTGRLLTFDLSYRPIQLKRIVEGLSIDTKNSFQQEKVFMNKVPDLIRKHSKGNSTLVFCATRNSTQQTAQLIAQGVSYTCQSNNVDYLEDEILKKLCSKGVAYHHAGISLNDRKIIENLFRDNKILILCSTSTLAVGVNINCYLVIIKGTTHWSAEGEKEYDELDIEQMIGRAGRPGTYDSGVAIILTTKNKATVYKSLVNCDNPIESTIHFHFLEHICSEIEIGSIDDVESCKEWITSTYYYIRYKQNPSYYNSGNEIEVNSDNDIDEMCNSILEMLLSSELIEINTNTGKYTCTEYGKTMCKNYLTFKSMKVLKGEVSNYTLKNLISMISQALAATSNKSIKNAEKIFLKTLNSLPKIKYPVLDKNGSSKKVVINHNWQKIFLLIQFQLEDIIIFEQENFIQIKSTILQDLSEIWKNANRIIAALSDIMIFKKNGNGLFDCLFLKRSFNGKAWDDGLKTILQVESLGIQSIRNLRAKKIKNLGELQALQPNKLEYLLGLKPGNGYKLKDKILKLPQICIHAECVDTIVSATGKCLSQIQIKIESPTKQLESSKYSQNYTVDIMIKSSLGDLCDYRKMSFSKIAKNKTFVVPVILKSQIEYFNISASIDKVAGSNKTSNVKVECPDDLKHALPSFSLDMTFEEFDSANSTSNRFEEAAKDKDIVNMLDKTIKRIKTENSTKVQNDYENISSNFDTSRDKLNNGNYACHHTCKNKQVCRHMCCHQGIPKNLIKRSHSTNENKKESLPMVSTPKQGAMTFEFSDIEEPSDLEMDIPVTQNNIHNSHSTSWGDTELEKYVLQQESKNILPTKSTHIQNILPINHPLRRKASTEYISDDSSDKEPDISNIINNIKDYSYENYEESSIISNNANVTIYKPKPQFKDPYITKKKNYALKPVSAQSCDNISKEKMQTSQISKLKEISFHESDFSFEIPKFGKAKEIEGLEFLGSDIEICDE